jgi:hypothetical protein
MGSRGPTPKENPMRRNKHEYATEITDEPQPGRELPRSLGVTTAGAKRFWKTWSRAPQTATWTETDWAELEITTVLVDRFYQGDSKLAGEIRQRVAKYGATPEDRARLRMKIVKKDEDETALPEESAERLVTETENFLKAFGA